MAAPAAGSTTRQRSPVLRPVCRGSGPVAGSSRAVVRAGTADLPLAPPVAAGVQLGSPARSSPCCRLGQQHPAEAVEVAVGVVQGAQGAPSAFMSISAPPARSIETVQKPVPLPPFSGRSAVAAPAQLMQQARVVRVGARGVGVVQVHVQGEGAEGSRCRRRCRSRHAVALLLAPKRRKRREPDCQPTPHRSRGSHRSSRYRPRCCCR